MDPSGSQDACGGEPPDPFAVLGFIEASGRGHPVDALRSRALAWAEKRFGDILPAADGKAGRWTAKHKGRTFVSVSRREGEDDIWACWLDDPVKPVRESCLITEVVIGSRHGRADRVGFRLLGEIPCDRIPFAGRDGGFSGAIESLCDLHATVLGAASQVSFVVSGDQTRNLTAEILDPGRTKPVIVVSTKARAQRASATLIDAAPLAKATNGLASVRILASSQSRLLTKGVGRRLAVFNGAARIYLPRVKKDRDARRHRLYCAAPSITAEHIEQSWERLQRRAARESGTAFAKHGGRLPYDALQEEVIGLKRRFAGAAGGPLSSRGIEGARTGESRLGQASSRLAGLASRWLGRIRGKAGSVAKAWRRLLRQKNRQRALIRLKRKLKETEARGRRLADKLGDARARNEALAAANSRLKKALRQREKRISDLEAALTATKSLPRTWDRVIGWCDTDLSGMLMLAPSARRELARARYADVQSAAQGLMWLATRYRDARRTGGQGELRGPIPDAAGLSNERCGSDSFDFIWEGTSRRVEWHVKRGNSRDARRCLRIYYFWDPRLEQVVVASMPAHRPTP